MFSRCLVAQYFLMICGLLLVTSLVARHGFQASQEFRAAAYIGEPSKVKSRHWLENRAELCKLVLLTQENLQAESTKKQEQVDRLDRSAQAMLEELAKVQAKKDGKQKSDVPKKSEKKSNTKSKRVCKTFNGIERCL